MSENRTIDAASLTLTIDEHGEHALTVCGKSGDRSHDLLLQLANLFIELVKDGGKEVGR
jgi:hypothetical protein